MAGLQFATATHYSKLVRITIENFMSIEYAVVEFDERGVINLKGYNDVGKSNILRAEEVLLDNANATQQLNFIRDDQDYFKVTNDFDDGVSISKYKFINGKSLYEMYKDGELLFTTRVNNNLTKVSSVPQPIKDYLGMISEEDIFLNSRTCYQPQVLVETTGSQNYRFLSSVLHSEELALTHTMLNTDKNAKYSELCNVEATLTVRRADLNACKDVSIALVEYLEGKDKILDTYDSMLLAIDEILTIIESVSKLVIYPKLNKIDTLSLDMLDELSEMLSEINNLKVYPTLSKIDTSDLDILDELISLDEEIRSIKTAPKVDKIDTKQLKDLEELYNCFIELSNLKVYPKVNKINTSDLDLLAELEDIIEKQAKLDEEEIANKATLNDLHSKAEEINSKLQSVGIRTVKCTNCGTILEVV